MVTYSGGTDDRPIFRVQLDEGAYMPRKAKDDEDNVGYDVKSIGYKIIYKAPFQSSRWFRWTPLRWLKLPAMVYVTCGVHVQPIDKSYRINAKANSRITKLPFILGNGVGVIDPNYTGGIQFRYQISWWASEEDLKAFEAGNVVGQLVVQKKYDAELVLVEKLEETDRGSGGFGSTAK